MTRWIGALLVLAGFTWLSTSKRLRCALSGGHLPVTKYGDGKVYRSCFRCDAQFGRGWDFKDITSPTSLTATQPQRKPRTFAEWTAKHGRRRSA